MSLSLSFFLLLKFTVCIFFFIFNAFIFFVCTWIFRVRNDCWCLFCFVFGYILYFTSIEEKCRHFCKKKETEWDKAIKNWPLDSFLFLLYFFLIKRKKKKKKNKKSINQFLWCNFLLIYFCFLSFHFFSLNFFIKLKMEKKEEIKDK